MKRKTNFLFAFLLVALISKANVAEVFFYESFNSNVLNTWQTGDASGHGVLWHQCFNPLSCPPASQQLLSCSEALFKSPGFFDGYMYVDGYEVDQLAPTSRPFLRTTPIDCSLKENVFIQFYTYIHATTTNPDANAVLRVRAGSGNWQTFKIFPDMNADVIGYLQGHNGQLVQIDISSVAANKENVQIEWSWTTRGDVAWMIDDVELFNNNPLLNKVIWNEDFSNAQNSWVVTQSPQYDTCRWRRVDSAMVHIPSGDLRADALACWSGVNNGAMLINASYCSFSGGPSPFTKTDLVSPKIDLSSIAPGTRLYLRFNQLVDIGNPAPTGLPKTSVAISINDGVSYIETIDVNPLSKFLRLECGEVNLMLPSFVAGSSKLKLKFTFSSDTHFWMVDDVRIATAYDNDLELNPLFFNVAHDFSVPASQVRPINLFAQVRNAGEFENSSATVHVAVFNAENALVFEDAIALPAISPSDEWMDVHFPNKWIPAAIPDEYLIYYWVTTQEVDANAHNNRIFWRYKVTENIFSKNEICPKTVSYFLPASLGAYEIGNCYYIPAGSKLKAEAVSFAFKDRNELLALNNAQLNINLYRWSLGDNNGDVNNDTTANEGEYEVVAQNIYEIQGTEEGKIITVPISFQPEVETILEDGHYYFVTIGYLDPVYVNNQLVVFPIAASEEINYEAAFFNSYAEGQPAFISMLREVNEDKFRANAWALRRIPFVNLHVSPYVNSTDDLFTSGLDFVISPNPANEIVRLTADFQDDDEPISVEIFDLCGKKVLGSHFETGNVSQQPIFVGNLSNGTYSIRVVSDEKMSTKKLLILR